MTDRARRETQEGTGVSDARRPSAVLRAQLPRATSPLAAAATPNPDAGSPLPAASTVLDAAGAPESWEQDPTDETPRPVATVEQATPTHIEASIPVEQATPTEMTARPERSEPIRVISMKDQADARPRSDERTALQVQLRSIAEVTRRHDTPVDLGRLAPPHDPRQARTRRLLDNALWASVAIILACAIMLAIWLLAGR